MSRVVTKDDIPDNWPNCTEADLAEHYRKKKQPHEHTKADINAWASADRAVDTIGTSRGKNEVSSTSAPPPKEIINYVPFPVDTFPAAVRQFVMEGAAAIGCDPAYIALPVLACLARAIGNRRAIKLKRTWLEFAIVWAAIIAKSGQHKSPSLQLATAMLHRLQAEANTKHQEALQQFQQDLVQYERDLTEWKRSKSMEPPPWEPIEPACPRYICNDTTIEALAAILALQFDGVLVSRDELAGFFNGIGEYKSGGKGSDLGHWLAAWSGLPLTVDRKTGAIKHVHIDRASVNLIGGIQPGVFRRVIGVEHLQDGLCARLLLAMPEPKAVRWTEETISQETEEVFENVLKRLLAMEPAADHEGKPIPFAMPLTPEAKQAWVDYYNRHRAEQADLDDDLSAAWSKLEAYTARFALIFQCSSWAAGEANGDSIDETSIKSAVTLSDWFANEAKRVYGILAETEQDREHRELSELVRRKGGTLTARDLMRCSRRYPVSEDAEAALDALAKAGYGRWEFDDHGGNRGRQTRRFTLTTAVDTDTNTVFPEKNAISVNVNTVSSKKTHEANGHDLEF